MPKISVEFDNKEQLHDLLGMINTAIKVGGLDAALKCLPVAIIIQETINKLPPAPVPNKAAE